MKDLIAKLQMDANCALGAIWMHIDAREKRVAELEAELAKLRAGAQVVAEPIAQPNQRKAPPGWDYDKQGGYLIGYGECKCVLPNYCDGKCKPIFEVWAPEAEPTAPLPASADKLHNDVMNLPCKPYPKWSDAEIKAYKYGHKDARHAAAELVAGFASSMALQAPVQQVPEGWQLVPVKPTAEMIRRAANGPGRSTGACMESQELIWADMLAAAPIATSKEQGNG